MLTLMIINSGDGEDAPHDRCENFIVLLQQIVEVASRDRYTNTRSMRVWKAGKNKKSIYFGQIRAH